MSQIIAAQTDLYYLPRETLAVLSQAKECPYCNTMAFVMTNRFGSTSCVGCAEYVGGN